MKVFNPNLKYLVKCYNEGVESKVGVCLEGSSRCFDKDQLIITDRGPVKISDLSINDKCLSYNHDTGTNEFKQVQAVIKTPNVKRCFKIKLKDGTVITCTEDHKFFYQQRYIEVKHILSLLKNKI